MFKKSLFNMDERSLYCIEMIDAIGGFLQHNLVVLVAVVVVPFKLIVLRICGDTEAQGGALLAIPEDMCYVALGLILGDVTSAGGAFRRHFSGSQHIITDLFVTSALTVIIVILVHLAAKFANDQFQGWRAAQSAQGPLPVASPTSASLVQPLQSLHAGADTNVRMIGVRYVFCFGLAYCFQFGIVIWWLSWIAKVVGTS